MDIEAAAEAGDIVMVLTPDELQAQIYKEQIEKHLKEGNVLAFAHGFNIHFNQITPPENVDVIMIAPKGPGHTVRSQYVEGKGVPSLIAVYQDASGKAKDYALAYASGIGARKPEEAGRAVGTGICLFAVFAVILTIVLVFGSGIIAELLHAPREAFDETSIYIRICGAGAVFIVAYNVLGAIFRGIGDSKMPLLTVAIACVLNLSLIHI